MRLVSFDELSPSMDVDRLLVHLSSLGGSPKRAAVDLWRRRSDIYADYAAIFAVDGGAVVGQTYVKRLEYAFPDGPETISAIASVGTRPDRARTGVARRILDEVHRREREAGCRYATLWTNPSWGAHRLYEKLGYRDVYTVPWALRPSRPARRSAGRRSSARPARRCDLAELQRIHDQDAAPRLGFCRRPKRWFETAAAVRDLDPAKELVVVRDEGRPVGYASVLATPQRALCGELVGPSVAVRRRLLGEIERRAGTGPAVLQGSLVADQRPLLEDRGYRILPTGWWCFMAKRLRADWDARTAMTTFATRDPRFTCQLGDRF